MSQEKLTVAIVGGGITGLTLANALATDDIRVDIYETAPAFSEIGAGLNIWLRSWEIFAKLGLDKTLGDLLPKYPDREPGPVFQFRKSDQKDGFMVLDHHMEGGVMRFHRADLQLGLLKHIPKNCHMHMSSRFTGYTETDNGVQLAFADGSVAEADLLVAGDGIKSIVRQQFIPTLDGEPENLRVFLKPNFTGTVAYRGLIPVEELERVYPGHQATKAPIMYCGKNKHVVVYPVSQGRFVNVVACASDLSKEGMILDENTTIYVPQSELLDTYAGWEPEVQAITQCITEPTKWYLQALAPLPSYGKGRIILAGDAAHAMSPHQGVGAGQGIEDAYILGALLKHRATNRNNIARVTDIYSAIRMPVGNRVLEASRLQGKRYQFNVPRYEDVREGEPVALERLNELFGEAAKAWEWVFATSAETERKDAIELLEQTLSPPASP